MNVMLIGDISGLNGIRTTETLLPILIKEHHPDLIIANGENSANGLGITPNTFLALKNIGIHVVTTGNHFADKPEILRYYDPCLIRPANFSADYPGHGYTTITVGNSEVCVINLAGREHMPPVDCPFYTADSIIRETHTKSEIIIIDFHAVSTTEKNALAWYLDGRCSCLVGTHTHIQTADERILPHGLGYISDLGMVGPWNSVLGVDPRCMIEYYRKGVADNFRLAEGLSVFCAIIVGIDEKTGKTKRIKRIQNFFKHLN